MSPTSPRPSLSCPRLYRGELCPGWWESGCWWISGDTEIGHIHKHPHPEHSPMGHEKVVCFLFWTMLLRLLNMIILRIWFFSYYPMWETIDFLKTTFPVFGLRGKPERFEFFSCHRQTFYTELYCKALSGLLKIIIGWLRMKLSYRYSEMTAQLIQPIVNLQFEANQRNRHGLKLNGGNSPTTEINSDPCGFISTK